MQKRLPFFLHLLLWTGLLCFNLFYGNYSQVPVPWQWTALDKGQTFLFHIALFYFNWFVLVPKILARDKVLLYALAVIGTLALFAAVRAPLEILEMKKMASYNPTLAAQIAKYPSRLAFPQTMFQLAVMGVMNIFLSSALKVTGDYLRNERRRKELEHQHTATELELLKAQVNPHFLFNTLNNIYSLAYQQAPNTPDAIMKLSLLLRYQLYETDTPLVPLEKELEHLQHLLDLHKLRLTNPSLLTLEVSGDVASVHLPPMLLMPLVENMFKHGVASASMALHLQVTDSMLTFTTRNQTKQPNASPTYGGLGLQNLRRRLDLLFPSRHTLSTQQDGQWYTATLILSFT
ncbi:histidine kinase [Nibribacter ruber]|uniref:Histidine kinase n=1 Tax=Nibribacter ruber TaxID=2698458 RepID=A0A6P1P0M7_9BACT|nr:sensor histidine kinase [Nibribacter ruber]QHL86542.1 histidine kinase [Nibribacter ruber]